MTQTCPSCAQPASGRFCANCGTALEAPRSCAECSAELPAGARFCNECGAAVAPAAAAAQPAARAKQPAARAKQPTGARPARSAVQPVPEQELPEPPPSRLPWLIAGVTMVALAALLIVPRLGSNQTANAAPFGTPPPAAGPMAGAPAAGPGGVDLSSMTPREAADRLFDRVMRTASAGDTAQARTFLPMALQAYERAEPLDNDGHYHVAVLHLLGENPAEARTHADAILASEPTHLFGLFTAAEAEQQRGNAAAARELHGRFLEAYPREVARDLPEYQAHAAALPEMRAQAQAAAGQ